MTLFTDLAPRIMEDLLRDIPAWGPEDAAACVGNLGHETGGFKYMQEIKPVVPGSRGGFGFAQWTGPRRKAFEAYAKARRLALASYEANYGYLLKELRTTEKAAVPKTHAAVGLEAKVKAFENNFERSGVKHYPSRLKYAQQAWAAYQTATAKKPPPPVITTDPVPDWPPADPESPPTPPKWRGFFSTLAAWWKRLYYGE